MPDTSKKTEPNDYAFPGSRSYGGLTKREEFAKAAMQGYLASSDPGRGQNPSTEVARYAIDCANDLIRLLNGEEQV